MFQQHFPGFNNISWFLTAFSRISHLFLEFPVLSQDFQCSWISHAFRELLMLYRDFPCLLGISQVFWARSKSKTVGIRALMLPFRYPCKSKITLQSKFQPNQFSRFRDITILFKIWPKFGPSSGTLWPIPKKFLRCNLPYCAGPVSKFQPSSFKIVAVVWQGRTFLAPILYMYRCNHIFHQKAPRFTKSNTRWRHGALGLILKRFHFNFYSIKLMSSFKAPFLYLKS